MRTYYYSQILKIAANIARLTGDDIRRTSVFQYDIGETGYVKATRQGGKIKIKSSREFDFDECIFNGNRLLLMNRNRCVAEFLI